MILLAGVLRASAAGATEPVVAGVTSTAAVLRYTAPDGEPCRIEAGESADFVPLAADVDAALFPGADLDSRPGSLSAGHTRVVVIGRRSMSYCERNGDGCYIVVFRSTSAAPAAKGTDRCMRTRLKRALPGLYVPGGARGGPFLGRSSRSG
jgi:hypothetical protein